MRGTAGQVEPGEDRVGRTRWLPCHPGRAVLCILLSAAPRGRLELRGDGTGDWALVAEKNELSQRVGGQEVASLPL